MNDKKIIECVFGKDMHHIPKENMWKLKNMIALARADERKRVTEKVKNLDVRSIYHLQFIRRRHVLKILRKRGS